jgi:hypothetical protein
MRKEFATDDHGELIDAAGGSAFQFFERSDTMTKSASDAISKKDVEAHMPPDGHFGVHLITMGAEEDFGCNRNCDAASRKSLEKYHPTFEKFGCVFREHKNKCQKTQGIGQIKLARYNDRMHRGELIVWVDKEKAPDMYKEAKAGKELSWSMSMRLPHDRCSCCDHKAKRTTDYCGHLKSAMGKYIPEFRKYAYARNEDDVKFFDISEVKRRADRIATFLGYSFGPEDMAKAASEDRIITGAEWAEHYGNFEPVPFAPWEAETLRKLAAEVQFVKHADQHTLNVLVASLPRALSHRDLEKLAKADFRSVGGELANRGIILDFGSFASIVTGKSVEELRKEAEFRDIEGLKIPELLEGMESNDGCACGDDAANAVTPDTYGCAFSSEKDAIDTLMDDVATNLELKPQAAAERAMTITIKMAALPQLQKTASFEPFYDALAESYGHYLVKAAHLAKDAPGVSANMLFRSIAAMQIFQAQKDCQGVQSRA